MSRADVYLMMMLCTGFGLLAGAAIALHEWSGRSLALIVGAGLLAGIIEIVIYLAKCLGRLEP